MIDELKKDLYKVTIHESRKYNLGTLNLAFDAFSCEERESYWWIEVKWRDVWLLGKLLNLFSPNAENHIEHTAYNHVYGFNISKERLSFLLLEISVRKYYRTFELCRIQTENRINAVIIEHRSLEHEQVSTFNTQSGSELTENDHLVERIFESEDYTLCEEKLNIIREENRKRIEQGKKDALVQRVVNGEKLYQVCVIGDVVSEDVYDVRIFHIKSDGTIFFDMSDNHYYIMYKEGEPSSYSTCIEVARRVKETISCSNSMDSYYKDCEDEDHYYQGLRGDI